MRRLQRVGERWWQIILIGLGSAVVATVVNMVITLVTQNPTLGFWVGTVCAFSLGWSVAKDTRV